MDTLSSTEREWQQAFDMAMIAIKTPLTAALDDARRSEAALRSDLENHQQNYPTSGQTGHLSTANHSQRIESWNFARQYFEKELSKIRAEVLRLKKLLSYEALKSAACNRVREQFPELGSKYEQIVGAKNQPEDQNHFER